MTALFVGAALCLFVVLPMVIAAFPQPPLSLDWNVITVSREAVAAILRSLREAIVEAEQIRWEIASIGASLDQARAAYRSAGVWL